MADPKVSVIIPTYNRAAMLPRAVDSVLAQTFTDFELLIVDDCSADETSDVVARLDDSRIRAFRHRRNRGSAATRNTGIANARGEYIAFLDDDDEFLSTKLERQVDALAAAGPDVGMVYTWRDQVDPTGRTVMTLRPVVEDCAFEQALGLRLILGMGSTSMFKASAFNAAAGFDESIVGPGEDLDFLCRFTKKYNIAAVCQVLVRLHVGHPRITTPTRSHLRERLQFTFNHMNKYRADLRGRRTVRAMLWQRIALLDWRIRNYPGVFRAVAASFANDPRTPYYAAKWMTKIVAGKIWRRG